MILSRRAFLTGLLAAPIIVRSGIIMPVRPRILLPDPFLVTEPGRDIDIVFKTIPLTITIHGHDQFGRPQIETVTVGAAHPIVSEKGWRTITEIVT